MVDDNKQKKIKRWTFFGDTVYLTYYAQNVDENISVYMYITIN